MATATRSTKLIDEYLTEIGTDGIHSPNTVTTYRQVLHRLDRILREVNHRGLALAHTDELRPLVLPPDRSPATRALYRAAVGGFFAWACDPLDPQLTHNPAVYLPRQRVPRRRPRPITNGQLREILTTARQPYRIWYLLAAYLGLRCVEIARLDRDDVTEEWTWVRGKGDRERQVPTHDYVWTALQDLPPGPVALDVDSQPADRRQISWRGNRHLRRIGMRGVTMHRVRHWYGTHVHEAAGGDARVTQDLLGHASLATTQGYVEVDPVAKLAAGRALPRVIG